MLEFCYYPKSFFWGGVYASLKFHNTLLVFKLSRIILGNELKRWFFGN